MRQVEPGSVRDHQRVVSSETVFQRARQAQQRLRPVAASAAGDGADRWGLVEVVGLAAHVVLSRYQDAPVAVGLSDGDRVAVLTSAADDEVTVTEALDAVVDLAQADHQPKIMVTTEPVPDGGTAIRLVDERDGGATHAVVEAHGDVADLAPSAFLAHMAEALADVASPAGPTRAVGLVPILPADEVDVLDRWNDTAVDYPDTIFADAFEAQVDATPDAIAVVAPDRSLTYRQLDELANGAARALADVALGPERVVGVVVERSVEALVVILAALKLGAAYVPIDPAHPSKRMAAAVDQARPDLLIAADDGVDTVADAVAESAVEVPVVALGKVLSCGPDAHRSTQSRGDAAAGDTAAGDAVDPLDHLAYILTTSGSTGVPKAAMITQRGLMNHAWAMIDALGLGPGDVVGHNARLTFDVSVWQMITVLLVGGTVGYAPVEATHAPDKLLAWLDDQSVTVLQLVPSLMASVLQTIDLGEQATLAPSMRWVIPTGEALPPATARRWLDHFGGPPLVNAYGPAECSDDVTLEFISDPPDETVTAMPIGRPLANTRIYVIDRFGGRVPIGVTGEICVAGVGVGRGYRQDPERTAAAFVPNPFEPATADGAVPIMYRTGDQGRFLPNGSLEYRGRNDHQVKVRGQRIELGEVEAAFRAHPSVDDALATTYRGELAVYLVGRAGTATGADDSLDLDLDLDLDAIRTFTNDRLPANTRPRFVSALDAFPLSANGKVDRARLPAPVTGSTGPGGGGVAGGAGDEPASELERRLAAIWCEVLEIDRVGRNEDFFDIGGDSLAASVLLWQIDRKLRGGDSNSNSNSNSNGNGDGGRGGDGPSPIRSRTIATQAAEIEGVSTGDGPSDSHLVPLTSSGDRVPMFLLPGQGGTSLRFVGLGRHLGSDQPLYGLEVDRNAAAANTAGDNAAGGTANGDTNGDTANSDTAKGDTVDALLDRYVTAIRSVVDDGPCVVGGYCLGGELALEVASRLTDAGGQVPLVVLLQSEGKTYPRYRSGNRWVRLGYKVADRASYEAATIRQAPAGTRRSKLAGLVTVPFNRLVKVPVERALAAVARRLGRDWQGSLEYQTRVRINDDAVYDHSPCEHYEGDVLLVAADHQPLGIETDPSLGWSSVVSGTLTATETPGYHRNILREPAVAGVADLMVEALDPINAER